MDLSQLLDPSQVASDAQTGRPPLPVDPSTPTRVPMLPISTPAYNMPQVQPADVQAAIKAAQAPRQPTPEEIAAHQEAQDSWKGKIKEVMGDKALLGAGLIALAGALKRPEYGQNSSTLFANGLENAVEFYNKQKNAEAAQATQDTNAGTAKGELAIRALEEQRRQNAAPGEIAGAAADTRYKNAAADNIPVASKQKDRELDLEEAKLKQALEVAKIKMSDKLKSGNITEAELKAATIEALMNEEGLSRDQALLRVAGLDFKGQANAVNEKQAGAGEDAQAMSGARHAVWTQQLGQAGAAKLERAGTELVNQGVMSVKQGKGDEFPTIRFPGLPADEEQSLLDAYDNNPKLYAEKLSALAGRGKEISKAESTLTTGGYIARDAKTGEVSYPKFPPAVAMELNSLRKTDPAKYHMYITKLATDQDALNRVTSSKR